MHKCLEGNRAGNRWSDDVLTAEVWVSSGEAVTREVENEGVNVSCVKDRE